ncbi:MAG: hypothetical protein HUU15_19270, partial [Candidatus Brocadiae bacterium]|nr:hypothetical protein [Candidatus Brocadiia bacterium]
AAAPVAASDPGEAGHPTLPPDPGVAGEDLARTARDAESLERAGNFQGALELWGQAAVSTPRGRATAARAVAAIEGRAQTRVEETIKDSPRGPRGALRLREVARGMPPDLARRLEESARDREAAWLPEDGIEHFRAAVRFPDLDSPLHHLARLEATTSASEKPTLDLAREMLRHAGETLQSASDWYRSHAGVEAVLQLADGSRLAVTLGAVDEQRRSIYATVEKKVIQIPLRSLSIGDFLSRATWGVPSKGDLLAAFDAAWLLGTREDLWALAFRARRRGVVLGKEREELLELSLPADVLAAVHEADRRLDRSWESREEAGAAARAYLARFARLPCFPERQTARELLAYARGPASVSDLGALLSAEVLGEGNRVTLNYGPGDELLADVEASGTWSVEPAGALRIIPGPGALRITVSPLEFSDPTVTLRIAPAGRFSLLFASRGAFEQLALTCGRDADGRATLELPLPGETLSAEVPPDGILEIRLTLQGRSLTVTLLETSRTVELPAAWSGAVGLELAGPATIHALRISGSAEFRTRDLDEELKPLGDAARKRGDRTSVQIGRWTPRPTDREGLVFPAGGPETALIPPEWRWGDHWAARFTALLEDEAELTLELRTSPDSEVRLSLLPGRSRSAVRFGDVWLTTGRIAPILRNRAAEFEIQVADDLASLEMNGKVIWNGRVHGAAAGGLRFRVRGGAEIRHLDMAELRPTRR